jgi:hypothetical protein
MVEPDSLAYCAVIDWGSAGWGDPARDFSGIPLRAVPFLLEGYREVRPPAGDATLEARILWCHLQLALLTMRRGPQPNLSWAERPMGMILDVLRFFVDPPGKRWRLLSPPK